MTRVKINCLMASILFLSLSSASWSADLTLINFDPPGTGLNDLTPAAPVGGNAGTTIGEQRQIVYETALTLWGNRLESNVEIFVGGTFQPLPCNAGGGVLASAGPTSVFANFPNPDIVPDTWYVGALADALADFDLDPGFIDIITFFNSDIDDNDPNCIANTTWYYGLDNNNADDEIDFLAVVMHEVAHGLGFLELISESTGETFFGLNDIYQLNMFDTTTGKSWGVMTDAERLASQVNFGNLVWTGPSVTAAAPSILGPRPSVKVLRPKNLKGSYEAAAASFGPPLRENGGTTGKMVVVDDGTGVGSDGCEPIVNKVRGKLALIDRGGCAFTTKVLNAQAARAKGVIVVNNVPVGPAPMGGSDPNVTIPSVGVTMALGNAFKAAANKNIVGKLILDGDFLAGASPEGLVRLWAPDPVAPGSSKSHWDTAATPNLLMEPSINDDLMPSVFLDLTPNLFEDIGWTLQ